MKLSLLLILTMSWMASAKLRNFNENLSGTMTIVANSKECEERELLGKTYKPQWSDLDTRPLPEWYDRAKIGIFLHWGVYSVPSFRSEWFWSSWKNGNKETANYIEKNFPPGFTYQQFAPLFTAEFFEPDQWAKLFKKAGAKYLVLTSKHHEGFTLFPSKRSYSWNSVDVGPHRDIVGDLSKAVRGAGIEFGVYHSMYEWYNPIYLEDKEANFTTYNYRDDKLFPDLKQLVNDYNPSVIWSDGDWEIDDTYWNSTLFLAWLYNESPVKDSIVVNDRWGKGTACKHGDFYNCEDRYHPGTLQDHKWENAFTLDKTSWGYRRNMEISEILSIEELLSTMVSTVSCGGNALINVGPTKEGTIAPIFQERLLQLGEWLEINGEAIYASSPWLHQNDSINTDAWYTCVKREYNAQRPTAVPEDTDAVIAIYAVFLTWPAHNILKLGGIAPELYKNNINKIEMLGQEGQNLNWTITDDQAHIRVPDKSIVRSKYAWTLKFTTKK